MNLNRATAVFVLLYLSFGVIMVENSAPTVLAYAVGSLVGMIGVYLTSPRFE